MNAEQKKNIFEYILHEKIGIEVDGYVEIHLAIIFLKDIGFNVECGWHNEIERNLDAKIVFGRANKQVDGITIKSHAHHHISKSYKFTDLKKIVEDGERYNSLVVTLNDTYKAELTANGIVVGCQTFPLEVIDKLVKAREKLNKRLRIDEDPPF